MQKYIIISKLHLDSSMNFVELQRAKGLFLFPPTKFCLGASLRKYLVFQVPNFI